MNVITLGIFRMRLVIMHCLEIPEHYYLRPRVVENMNFLEAFVRQVNEINVGFVLCSWEMGLCVKTMIGGTIVGYKEHLVLVQSRQLLLHADFEFFVSEVYLGSAIIEVHVMHIAIAEVVVITEIPIS